MSKLYIIATPIGNIKDITYRAVEIMRDEADIIFCESTLMSQKIFKTYNISKPTSTFNITSSQKSLQKIADFLQANKNVAYISDAGTPGISDPGAEIVAYVRENMPEIEIISVGGISALTTLISVSGINISNDNPLIYYGFIPHKKGRETLIKKIATTDGVHVFYESVHRFEKLLEQMQNVFNKIEEENEEKINKKIIVGRELTKIYEQIIIGNIDEVSEYFKNNPDKIRGEFVIVVA